LDRGSPTVERAIELYRAALGRNVALSTEEAQLSNLSGAGEKHERDVGGPIDRLAIFSKLAAALLSAGRPREAVAELELALAGMPAGMDWTSTGSNSSEVYSEQGRATTTVDSAAQSRATGVLWDSLLRAKVAAGDIAGAIAAGKLLQNHVLINPNPTIDQLDGRSTPKPFAIKLHS